MAKQKILSARELDTKIAREILESTDQEFRRKISRIEEFLQANMTQDYQGRRLGEYYLNFRSRLFFASNPGDKQAIGDLYDNHATRKQIFYALGDFYSKIHETYRYEQNRDPRGSSLSLSPYQFYSMMDETTRFAKNQLLGSWKKSKGKSVRPTKLSRQMHLRPKVEEGKLVIDSDQGPYVFSQLDSEMLGTSSSLPFMVYILNKFYKQAEKVLEKN